MRHPEVFGSLYIMSPCCMSARGTGPNGADLEKTAQNMTKPSDSEGMPFFARAQLATAAAWSPNPKNPPLYLDLPTKDGAPQPAVLAKWAANAPLAFVDQYIGNLKQYHGISMDVGDQDGLRADAARLHDIMDSVRHRQQLRDLPGHPHQQGRRSFPEPRADVLQRAPAVRGAAQVARSRSPTGALPCDCLTRLILFAALVVCLAGTAAAQPVAVSIDATKVAPPVSRLVFGGFMEPATTGVWAEMLADRKFFAEITSKPITTPTGGFGRRGPQRRWLPVGPDAFVTMDRTNAYAGEWSPRVQLEAATKHGIDQAGLVLKGGRAYSGRVILAGSPGARVAVSLVWGPNPADRQTVTVPPLTATFAKVPLSFTAKADTTDGHLEIVGTGTGSFHIGAVSLMPADNVSGFKAATLRYLKELGDRDRPLAGRQLRVGLRLARRHRRSRQAPSAPRTGLERDGVERHGDRRLHDVLPAHRRGALPRRELGPRRRPLGR